MPTLQYLADWLCEDEEMEYVVLSSKKTGNLEKIEVGSAKSIFTKIKEYPYEFEINSALQLASINGIKIATNDSSYDELKSMIMNIQNDANIKQQAIEKLQKSNDDLKNEIEKLKNETILNKRINIMNNVQEFSLEHEWPSIWSGQKDVTLNDSIEGYKYLEIQIDGHWLEGGGYWGEKSVFIATEQLNYNNTNNANYTNGSDFSLRIDLDERYVEIRCWLKNNRTICFSNVALTNSYSNGNTYDKIRIKNIYGIK